jgi:thiol-disulfide isomerase/thioredoxin
MLKYDDIYNSYSGVIELKYKDFKINKGKLYINNKIFKYKGLIVFYSPLCTHCNTMSDEYSDIASVYLNKYPIGAVNCEDIDNKNDKLAKVAKINKYPIIKYINNKGLLKDYDTKFIKNNILYFININI